MKAELQSYLNVLIEDKTILTNSLVREFFEVESYVKNYDKEKVPQRKSKYHNLVVVYLLLTTFLIGQPYHLLPRSSFYWR